MRGKPFSLWFVCLLSHSKGTGPGWSKLSRHKLLQWGKLPASDIKIITEGMLSITSIIIIRLWVIVIYRYIHLSEDSNTMWHIFLSMTTLILKKI